MSNSLELRSSDYNVFGYFDNKWILSNTFSSAIVVLDDAGKGAAERLLADPSLAASMRGHRFVDLLIDNGFLIPAAFSEMEFIKKTHGIAKQGEDSLGLAITTTMQCNFRCSYCYEFDRLGPDHLTEKLETSILALLSRELPKKKVLHVVWWGGEPLLRPQTIERLSQRMLEICSQHRVSYLGSITTNGSLLNAKNAALLRRYHVKRIQITIDGDRESHDERRISVSGGATFDKIVSNLKENSHLFENISLRLNIDRRNYQSCIRLLDELEPIKQNIYLAPRPSNDPHAKERPEWLLTLKEFIQFEEEFNVAAYRKGFRIVVGYSDAGMTYCNAYQSKNSFSVDPYGGVHICPIFTGSKEEKFGTITESGEIVRSAPSENSEIRLTDTQYPFSDKNCMSCKALPVCMGGCALYDGAERPGMGDLRCVAKHNIAEKMYLTRAWDFSAKKAVAVS
jgi:uncharacterized protein